MSEDLKQTHDPMDTYQQSSPGKRRTAEVSDDGASSLHVIVMSFGYKQGLPPSANIIFDVRFLKNPYWVDELRPLNGKRDLKVQQYVMNQDAAVEFLDSVTELLVNLLPRLPGMKVHDFTIAFGCTGGQHRSATMCEMLAGRLSERFPEFQVERMHRELGDRPPSTPSLDDL